MVDERTVALLTGRTVRAVQHDRRRGIGIPFKRINGATVRYKVADILDWLDSLPSGGSQPAEDEKKCGSRKVA
jgi:phage terminase Nu1 subunit (DNA packaging protein)